jgi:hypothetical protein
MNIHLSPAHRQWIENGCRVCEIEHSTSCNRTAGNDDGGSRAKSPSRPVSQFRAVHVQLEVV